MPDYREWVPDEAVEKLTVRRALQEVEDPLKMAAELLKEALPLATMSMTHMAIYSSTESIRFQAAKYVMDKSLGDSKDLKLPDNKPAWEQIYESTLVEAENILKRGEQ